MALVVGGFFGDVMGFLVDAMTLVPPLGGVNLHGLF